MRFIVVLERVEIGMAHTEEAIRIYHLQHGYLLALGSEQALFPHRFDALGNGSGFSVLDVIEAVRRVTQRPVPVEDAPRRAGDPARLVADSRLVRKALGWSPRFEDLETIVAHAWAFEQRLRGG